MPPLAADSRQTGQARTPSPRQGRAWLLLALFSLLLAGFFGGATLRGLWEPEAQASPKPEYLSSRVAGVDLGAGADGVSGYFPAEEAPVEAPAIPVPATKAPKKPAAAPVARRPAVAYQSDSGARLRIARLGINAPLVPVGLTKAGAMAVPSSRYSVGWYRKGPWPGERGSAVLAGHSGYSSGPVVFDKLPKLRKGDLITVRDKGGRTTRFKVVKMRLLNPSDAPPEVFSSSDGKAHMNLITCTGGWDPVRKTHRKRLVVFTDAVK